MKEHPEARAHRLLWTHLSREQRQTYAEHKWFEIRGGRSGRTYRIHGDGSGPGCFIGRNVTLMRRGKPVISYNAHPKGWAPQGDVLLAQKLALEDRQRERKFVRMACITAHSLPSFWPSVAVIFFSVMAVFQAVNLFYMAWRHFH